MPADLDSLLGAAEQLHRDLGHSPLETTASLARALDLDDVLAGHALFDAVDRLPPDGALQLSDSALGPDALGLVYERLLGWEQRHRSGSHFTPPDLASSLLDWAMRDWQPGQPLAVCDPAAGSGAFLLAAARALEYLGLQRPEIVGERLFGADLSAEALLVADAALVLWAQAPVTAGHLRVGDSTARCLWERRFPLVVGNPPFQNQLGADTARSPSESAALQERFGDAARGYVDSAALFLLAALDLVGQGGRMMMIQPQSTLAATDAADVRWAVQEGSSLRAVWLGDRSSFDAEVEVCALLVEVDPDGGQGPVEVFADGGEEPVTRHDRGVIEAAPTWSALLAGAAGVPVVTLRTGDTLGDLCSATAGFRDQFYGLAGYTHEQSDLGDGAPLVTVGMIDPARSRWGAGSFRFNKRTWSRPVVDLVGLARDDPGLGDWVAARLMPKVCVATQTRVIEAVADPDGSLVPATPVLAVHTAPEQLWSVLAVLLAPPISAWAMGNHAGAALSSDALRLSAGQVLQIPLPCDPEAWSEGANHARAATTAAAAADPDVWRSEMAILGERMCAAYAIADQQVLAWWEQRLPPWR